MSWIRRSWIVALGSLPFVLVELLFPFGRDQGNYAYPAWRWLAGEMPYRDVFVFKPPATVWVHALALLCFGHSMIAIRILDVIWTVGTALCVAAITARWTGSERTAALAGVLATFLYADFDYWNTCQTDGWFNLPIAGAVLLATRRFGGEAGRGALLLAGALLGLAVTFKYTAAAAALPVVVILAWQAGVARRPAQLVADLAQLAMGAAVPILATAAWLCLNGAIPAFVDSQAHLVPTYVARTGRATGLWDVPGILLGRTVELEQLRYLFLAAATGLGVVVLRARGAPRLLFAVAWFVGGLASTVAQNKFFRYHFLSVIPGAAVLGAIAVDAALTAAGRHHRAAGIVLALTLIAPSIYLRRWQAGVEILTGALTLDAYQARSGFDYNQMSVKEVVATARRLKRTTRPGDHVFVWGFDPVINFLAERPTVSRFLYNYPFSVAWGDPGYEAELMTALKANPPAVFVVGSKDATPHVTGNPRDSAELFAAFTALHEFVEAHYGEPRAFYRYTLYRREP